MIHNISLILILDPIIKFNLHLNVMYEPEDKIDVIIRLLNESFVADVGIIYCATINEVVEMYWKLKDQNIDCEQFHGQLVEAQKRQVLKRWLAGDILVIIATQAFGMGINKVECQIYYTLSDAGVFAKLCTRYRTSGSRR